MPAAERRPFAESALPGLQSQNSPQDKGGRLGYKPKAGNPLGGRQLYQKREHLQGSRTELMGS